MRLFHRISRDEILDNDTRRRLHEIVREEPGIHLRDLRRRLDTGGGTLDHHLDLLAEADLITEVDSAGYTCYFPPGEVTPDVMERAGKLRSETARAVVAAAMEETDRSLSEVAETAGVSLSTVNYHVNRLAESNLVETVDGEQATALNLTKLGRRAAQELGVG